MPRGRPPRERPEAVRRRLETLARRLGQREARLGRELAQLRAERDQAIRDAHAAGLPLRDIGAIVGLSHQRVSRIVRQP